MGETTYNKNNKGEKISGFVRALGLNFSEKAPPSPHKYTHNQLTILLIVFLKNVGNQ
jgi:hypothetical protein